MKTDKIYHAITSAIIVVVLSFVLPLSAACVITAMIGCAKEAFDNISKTGIPENGDLLADAIGIFAGFIVKLVVDYIFL
ncbi:MAG: hypothetical protein KBT03_10990 [Bacteroidales bacterium]|nr:hypothetical protein [Candidatus Scybalousia scybalohippi]